MLAQVGPHYLNTDHVVSVEGTATGWVVTLVTGKSITFPTDDLYPDEFFGTIVPAPAGVMLLEALLPHEGDTDREVRYRISVIHAFRVMDPTTAPVPIGAFGEPKTGPHYEYAVVQPDGQCFGREAIWESLDAFKAEQQAWADGRRPPAAPAWLTQAHRRPADLDPQRGL